MVYPGWWRSFFHSLVLAKQVGAKKIIHIESDAYVISERMLDYINALESGWTTFWCASYQMPETAIQVICEDQFDAMENFAAKGFSEFNGHLAERILPFTCINRDFIGDRYGEFKIPILRSGILKSRKFNTLKIFQHDRFRQPIPKSADFATQVTPDQKFNFQGIR